MRRAIERLVNRAFTSRWGIAVVLAILVLAVIGVGRIFSSGTAREPVLDTATAEPVITADPKDDDSAILTSEPPPTIAVKPGTAEPEAVAYAFASAWVDHRGVSARKWLEGLLPHATEKLAGTLEGVDPTRVPADRITGRPDLTPVGDGLAEAVVTADTGKLRLRLTAPDGHWLVDGVDWEQS